MAELHLKLPVANFNCTLPGMYFHLSNQGFNVLLVPGHEPKFNWWLFARRG